MLAKIEDSNKTRIFVTYMLAKKMAILWQYFGCYKITITFMLARQNGNNLAFLDSRYLYVGVVTFYVGKNQKQSGHAVTDALVNFDISLTFVNFLYPSSAGTRSVGAWTMSFSLAIAAPFLSSA